jgi:RNA polymerase sigma-70 factor (ECF subfamily)
MINAVLNITYFEQFSFIKNVLEVNFDKNNTETLQNGNILHLYCKSILHALMDEFQYLLNQCKAQNRKACITFYDMFYKNVYNSCLRILNNQMEAEEVMQDTFIKAFQTLDHFSGDKKNMLSYLQKIAIHKSINIIKKQKKYLLTPLNEESDDLIEVAEDNSKAIDFQIKRVKECIKQLPEGYKLILNLHLIEGLDYESIAQFLNIKASSVRSQYTRAIKKLKKLLK